MPFNYFLFTYRSTLYCYFQQATDKMPFWTMTQCKLGKNTKFMYIYYKESTHIHTRTSENPITKQPVYNNKANASWAIAALQIYKKQQEKASNLPRLFCFLLQMRLNIHTVSLSLPQLSNISSNWYWKPQFTVQLQLKYKHLNTPK